MKYFLDKSVSFRRLRIKSGDRSAFSATGTVEKCSWQTPSLEKIQMYEGQIGKIYSVYFDGELEWGRGDEVVRDGVIYKIRDIKIVDFGSQHYTELVVVETND